MIDLLGGSDSAALAPSVSWMLAGTAPPRALHADGLALGVRGLPALDGSGARAQEGRLFVVADGRPTGAETSAGPADTLLRTYRSTGIPGLRTLPGAWSAAIVDRRNGHRDLVLARGGRGACPIYVARAGPGLVFSSSIATLLSAGALPRRVDAETVRDYLAGRAPRDAAVTFLSGVRRIPPGHWLRLDWTGGDHPLPAPVAFAAPLPPGARPLAGATADGHPVPLPTSTEFLAELPEAVRQLEQPLPGAAQYLAWRAEPPGTRTSLDAPASDDIGSAPADEAAARWLRVRRAQVQGILRSPTFCGRPYWDGPAAGEAFRRACGRSARCMDPFWRLLNAELWLRLFLDRDRDRLGHPLREGELEQLGDPVLRAGIPAVRSAPPHRGRHTTMIGRDRAAYLRLPVPTRNVWPGHDLTEVVDEGLAGSGLPLRPGDVVILAEKIVAISQGHVVSLDEVRVRLLSRLLARFVYRTPSGISLGLPESFELAVREAGLPRILAGSAATALTRPLGIRGVFYRFAGWEVAAIDSPDPDALPPSNTCIKLAPHDPAGVSARLAEHLSAVAGARIEVAVVDVNDIGAEVLGASQGVDRRLLVSVLRDNPLGQDRQQTPVGVVRRVVPAGAWS